MKYGAISRIFLFIMLRNECFLNHFFFCVSLKTTVKNLGMFHEVYITLS